VAHVDGYAELAAAVVVEQAALVRVRVGVLLAVGAHDALVDRQLAWGVEAGSILDLDDFGAVVGEQSSGDGPDAHPAEVSDPDAGQRTTARPRVPAVVVDVLHAFRPLYVV
jgi:hypothetical protein